MLSRKKQFKVLAVSSLTEFGERYVNYTLQALLIFYLIDHFHFHQNVSSKLVGTTLSVLYISAIVGGYIADRLLTYYSAAFLGTIFMLLGCATLTLTHSQHLLYFALSLISIATGLIKSNISSFIGRFYDIEDLTHGDRDFGFNIFYVGINSGALIALLLASYLKNTYGFQTAFFSTVVASLLISINLLVGFQFLKKYVSDFNLQAKNIALTFLIIGVYLAFLYVLFLYPFIAGSTIIIALGACLYILFKSLKSNNKKDVFLSSTYFLLSIIYWSLYFQIFISILLFINRCVDHHVFGLKLTSSQFISVENFFVLVFGAFMGKIWLHFSRKNKPVHDMHKFAIGFIFIVLMYCIFYSGIHFIPQAQRVPGIIFLIGFMLLAISDLSLSAIGLSMVTKLAPDGFVSLYMGIWLVTLGIGGKFAGFLSSYIEIPHQIVQAKQNMANGILVFIGIAILGILICFVTKRIVGEDQSSS